MRKMSFALLAATLPFTVLSVEIKNPGFEDGLKPWEVGWNFIQSIDADVAHDGEKSLVMDLGKPFGNDKKPAQVSQTAVIDQKEPAPIRFSCWWKSENVTIEKGGYCRLRLIVTFDDGTNRANKDDKRLPMNVSFSGTHDWTYLERLFTFKKPVKQFVVLLQGFNAEGKIWFDDFSIDDLGKTETAADNATEQSNDFSPCQLKAEKSMSDYILKNQFVQSVISPKGGRVVSFIDKRTGGDLTTTADGEGIAKDALNELSLKAFWNVFYTLRDKVDTPEKASVTLVGESDAMPYFSIVKTYSLDRLSSLLTITVELVNNPESMATRYFTLRHHNGIHAIGEKTLYHIPTSKGVSVTKQGSCLDVYHRDVIAGWAAAVGENSGDGVVLTVDYAALDFFYNWFGGETTLENFFKTVEIDPGESWTTILSLMPVEDMPTIDAAVPGLAVGFDKLAAKHDSPESTSFELRFASDSPRTINVTLSTSPLNSHDKSVIAEKTISLSPEKTAVIPVKWAHPNSGDNLLECEISGDGETILVARKQVVFGESSGSYAFKPEKEKIPTVESALPLRLTDEFVTPHVKWAKPLPGGPIKTLGIIDTYNARELVELRERLDMTCDVAAFGHCADHFGKNTPKAANGWLKKLLENDYDLIIVGGVNWSKLVSPANRKKIIEKVKNGCDLLYVFPTNLDEDMAALLPLSCGKSVNPTSGDWKTEGRHPITDGVPFDALPKGWGFPWETDEPATLRCGENPVLACLQLDKSRVVALGYPVGLPGRVNINWWGGGGLTPTPPTPEKRNDWNIHYPHWEYAYLLLANAARWAIGRDSDVTIESIDATPEKVTVKIDNRGKTAADLKLNWALIDDLGTELGNGEVDVAAAVGQSEATIKSPKVKGGTELLHLRLLSNGTVLDSAAVKIDVPFAAKVTSLTVDFAMNGQSVELKGGAAVSQPCDVNLSLRDVDDREVAAGAIEKAEGTANFALSFKDPVYRAYRLIATPMIDGVRGDAFATWLYLPLKRRRYDDYTVVSWLHDFWHRHSPFYLNRYLYGRLRDFGFEEFAVHCCGWKNVAPYLPDEARFIWRQGADVTVNNLTPLHLHKRTFDENKKKYQQTGDRKCLRRHPCLDDPKDFAKTEKRIAAMTGMLTEFEPSRYSLGDENSLTMWGQPFDFCFSDATLGKLRQAMREKFENVDALNEVWGTRFKSFDEVVPATTDEAKKSENYASWLEHRRQMERSVVDFYRSVKDDLREKDPEAVISLSGTQAPSVYTGFNWHEVMEVFKDQSMQPYGGVQLDLMSSFAGPEFRCYPWSAGYGNKGSGSNYRLWKEAFQFRGTGCSFYEDHTATNIDMSVSPQARDFLATTTDLRRGLGKLLFETKPVYDDVAVLFSPDSQKIALITGQTQRFDNSVKAWVDLLSGGSWKFRFIDPKQINRLDELGVKSLVLPFALVLSKEHVAALRTFVENGGWLIADARAGAFDGNGRPSTAAESLFGIKPAHGDPVPGSLTYRNTDTRVTLDDGGLVATNSKPLGDVEGKPAIIRNKIGKGGTFYLNFLVDQYPTLRIIPSENAAFQGLLADLLEQCGVKRKIARIVNQNGIPPWTCRAFGFEQGDALLMGLVNDPNAKAKNTKLTVTFDEKRHVYDARKQRYLGETNKLDVNLPAAEAAMFALLPRKIDELTLQLNDDDPAQGDKVTCSIAMKPNPGYSPVVNVHVIAPDGSRRKLYGGNVILPDGSGSASFRTALNDPPGQWRIRAIDAVSGVSTETTLVLKERL